MAKEVSWWWTISAKNNIINAHVYFGRIRIQPAKAARSKAQETMSFLASSKELRNAAQEQILLTLDTVRYLSLAHVERKTKHIRRNDPSLLGVEKANEILRLHKNTIEYTLRQLLAHLKENQHITNEHVL